MNIEQFIKRVERETFLDHGFSSQMISNFISDGSFPAARYMQIKAIADTRDVRTPIHLFRWTEFSSSAGYQTLHEPEIKSL